VFNMDALAIPVIYQFAVIEVERTPAEILLLKPVVTDAERSDGSGKKTG